MQKIKITASENNDTDIIIKDENLPLFIKLEQQANQK